MLSVLESSFHEHSDGTVIVNWRLYLAQPDVAIGIPATNLLGQGVGPAIGHAFGYDLVISRQQPAQLFVRASPAIHAPDGPVALSWS